MAKYIEILFKLSLTLHFRRLTLAAMSEVLYDFDRDIYQGNSSPLSISETAAASAMELCTYFKPLKLDKILPNKNTSAVVVSEKEGINIDNDFHLELARKMCKG